MIEKNTNFHNMNSKGLSIINIKSFQKKEKNFIVNIKCQCYNELDVIFSKIVIFIILSKNTINILFHQLCLILFTQGG